MNIDYQRPAPRPFDPRRVNELWKQIRAFVGDLDDREVADALQAAGVPISRSRVAAWGRAEHSDKFSPMSIEELGATLDALIVAERSRRNGEI